MQQYYNSQGVSILSLSENQFLTTELQKEVWAK